GFGGYVCPPAYLAAASLRRPLVVHEANRRPGLANRLGALRAKAVLTAFEDSSLPGARRIGMPMREAIAHLDRAARRDEAVRRKIGRASCRGRPWQRLGGLCRTIERLGSDTSDALTEGV